MNPWPYYPPDYGDPNLAARSAYQLWEARNRAARSRGAGLGEPPPPPLSVQPWNIDKPAEEEPLTKSEKRELALSKFSLTIGLIGGVMGLILSWRALRGRQ